MSTSFLIPRITVSLLHHKVISSVKRITSSKKKKKLTLLKFSKTKNEIKVVKQPVVLLGY